MYDPLLTAQSLYSIVKEECAKHGVCFHFVYEKVISGSLPKTRNQLFAVIEDIMVTAFWSDYDHLYESIPYPTYAVTKLQKPLH